MNHTNCHECAKFIEDWRDAVQDFSRRSIVYATTAIALDEGKREEETARIEGARIRAEGALEALREHRRLHEAVPFGHQQQKSGSGHRS